MARDAGKSVDVLLFVTITYSFGDASEADRADTVPTTFVFWISIGCAKIQVSPAHFITPSSHYTLHALFFFLPLGRRGAGRPPCFAVLVAPMVCTPRRARRPPAARAPLAAAVRVVDRVHRHASRGQPGPQPPLRAGFPQHAVLVLAVARRHCARSTRAKSAAAPPKAASPSRTRPRPSSPVSPSRPRRAPACPCPGSNSMLWMSVPAGIDRRGIAFPGRMSTFSSPASTAIDFIPSVANTYAGLFPLALEIHQRDARRPVRVVLDPAHHARDAAHQPLEVHHSVLALVAAAACHTVMRPRLLRPPLFARPFVSALNGLPFHRWSRAVVMRPRWPGLVGLYPCGAREQKRRRRRIGG